MSEPNQVLWRGIRPTSPTEYIPTRIFKSDEEQYYAHNNASGYTTNVVLVPSGQVYHVINIFVSLILAADGSGYIYWRDGSNNIKGVIHRSFSDTYRILSPPVILLAPIDLLEGDYIEISSDTSGFSLQCSIIYTKE